MEPSRNQGLTRFRLLAGLAAAALAGVLAWRFVLRPEPGAGPGPPAFVPGTSAPRTADDPRQDGWDTEVLSEAVLAQLKVLEQLLLAPAPAAPEGVEGLVTEGFSASSLRPEPLEEAFRDRAFTVRRAAGLPAAASHRGREGFTRALLELAGPMRGARDRRTKFKIFRLRRLTGAGPPAGVEIGAYFQASGAAAAVNLQWSATWRMEWEEEGERPPRLRSIAVERHEEVEAPAASPPFADCTEAVLARNAVFDPQLRPGIDHWMGTIDVRLGIDVGGWQGAAVGDADGDGLDDLYLCQPGGLPNRLFLQSPDGTAREATSGAGADWLESTHAALLLDLDNDGDRDLALSIEEGVLLLENDGGAKFRVALAKPLPAAIPYSLAACDFDDDGDLDLYAACYNPRRGVDRHLVFARPVPYHDAQNGGRNSLLRNDGGWRFTDVTRRVGLDENNRRFSYAAAWEDFDDDGDLDLFVANDFGRKNLYRNDGGRFRDVAAEAGVEDIGPGMSAAWGDCDGDGLLDLYVSNMFSSAGNRVSFQPRFHPLAPAATRSQFQRHARGNSLFRNRGDGRFEEIGEPAGVTVGRWAWGSLFLDLNNDGRQDIVVANGFITQEDPADL